MKTIIYDIDMLDYCFARLGGLREKGAESNLCLEGFLLHYRNLIEFFASHGLLKARSPKEWSPRVLSPTDANSIRNATLYKTYRKDLSRYLSHCDPLRAEGTKVWNAVEMYGKIKPFLDNFRRLFPSEPRQAVGFLGPTDASTASVSTPSISVLLDSEKVSNSGSEKRNHKRNQTRRKQAE